MSINAAVQLADATDTTRVNTIDDQTTSDQKHCHIHRTHTNISKTTVLQRSLPIWLSHSVSAAREVLFDSRAGGRSSHVSCRLLHCFVAHHAMRKLLLRLRKTCTGASVDAVYLVARKRTIIDPHSLHDKNTYADSECDVTTKLRAGLAPSFHLANMCFNITN